MSELKTIHKLLLSEGQNTACGECGFGIDQNQKGKIWMSSSLYDSEVTCPTCLQIINLKRTKYPLLPINQIKRFLNR